MNQRSGDPDRQPGAHAGGEAGRQAGENPAGGGPAPGMRRPLGTRVRAGLLSADAWVDTAIWRLFSSLRSGVEGYSAWLRRFRARGAGRVAAELASDGVTFGLLGLIVLLTLAQDAFQQTERADWRTTEDFSVTFLDRFGNEIGKRGILLNDTVPLEEIPDHLIKAALATEDRRFFYHFGIDVMGTFRAMMENVRARTVVQGGSSITQQLAKNLFLSNERTLERKINEAFLALWLEMNLSKREILKLYSFNETSAVHQQINGIREMVCRKVVRRTGEDAWRALGEAQA